MKGPLHEGDETVKSKVVDLSFPIHEGMPTNDLGPKIWDRVDHGFSRRLFRGTQSRAGRVFLMTDHTGTHMDAPLRFDPEGSPVEEVPLEDVVLPARVFDLRSVGRGRAFGPDELETTGTRLEKGEAAVLWTGHDLYSSSPEYFWHRPWLSGAGAEWLASRGARLVAADLPGLGDPADDRFEAKRILHRGGALTVEQLCNLDRVEGAEWSLSAPPLRVRGCAGSPVRAAALVGMRPETLVDLTLDTHKDMPSLGPVPTTWTRTTHQVTAHFLDGEASYQTNALFLSEHAGTHLDAPYHFDHRGRTLDQIPLTELLVRARVLDLTHKKPLEPIDPADLDKALEKSGTAIEPGDGAVVWTGHSKNYYTRDDYTTHRPYISREGAEWLVARRPAIVITDLIGLDPPFDLTEPVHNCILRAGLCMLQVLTNLEQLAEGDWWVAAFPLNLVGGTGAPLRAYALTAAG